LILAGAGFVLHEEDEEEDRRQKRHKKADGAAANTKVVKSLKSVLRDKAVEFTV
jgi:hypothetical protein